MTSVSKKQYILCGKKLVLPEMREHKIGEIYLYAHVNLNMVQCETADCKKVILLGSAFCTDKAGKSVCDDISAFSGDDIESVTEYWTGRWTLITENEIITDACGLMGAFYGEKEGNVFISSSPALIAEVMEYETESKVKADGINWQILPYSIVQGVRSLLCTQKIVFENGNITVSQKILIKDEREKSTDEKCRAVADMLVNACKNIHSFSGKNITLALTGGKDSRLTFSALLKSGVPFNAYTAEHGNISHSDKTVPAALAKKFGIEHSYVKSKPFSEEMLADYYNFCAGNSNGADAMFYARGQFSSFGEDALIIRSGLFEAGQTYARSYTAPDISGFAKGMTDYYSDLRNSDKQASAFKEWINNAKEHPISHIDIRDRFYIEQRVGGWAAAIEQSLDINDFTSIQIANCSALLSILLSCSDEERKNLALSYETIKILESQALSIEINKASLGDILLRIKKIAKNPRKKLKNFINKIKRK